MRTEIKKLWKAKLPLKIKVFMWLVKLNAILTRDNLSRKGWQGDKMCSFCSSPESTEHLFFSCVISKYCWSLVSVVVRADCRPGSSQFWVWANKFMPSHKKFHMIGLAAICWAIWLTRNAISFERKNVDLLLRLSVWLLPLWLIGQVFRTQVTRWCWSRERKP